MCNLCSGTEKHLLQSCGDGGIATTRKLHLLYSMCFIVLFKSVFRSRFSVSQMSREKMVRSGGRQAVVDDSCKLDTKTSRCSNRNKLKRLL